jgi:hypothetical protein
VDDSARELVAVPTTEDFALNCRVIDGHPVLLPQLFELTVTQRVRYIPPNAGENDVFCEVRSLEADHHLPLSNRPEFRRGIIPEKLGNKNMRQNRFLTSNRRL